MDYNEEIVSCETQTCAFIWNVYKVTSPELTLHRAQQFPSGKGQEENVKLSRNLAQGTMVSGCRKFFGRPESLDHLGVNQRGGQVEAHLKKRWGPPFCEVCTHYENTNQQNWKRGTRETWELNLEEIHVIPDLF